MVRKLYEEGGIAVYELSGSALRVNVTNLGAHIISLWTGDRDGGTRDVVLGFEDIKDYENDPFMIGATVGRVANRIRGAQFDLNGITYRLAANEGRNHIHGGLKGFDSRYFRHRAEDDAVIFCYVSPDGEEGYPGTLELTVTYRLEDDKLRISYDAVSDRDTLINLTNHTYFDLSGGCGNIYDHELKIAADYIAENDGGSIPTGRFLPVAETPFDFRSFHKIGERINDENEQLALAGGYDHAYLLNNAEGPQIVLKDEGSGIELQITTDMPAVQLYSGNWLAVDQKGKGGRSYAKGGGVALETEFLPDSIHIEKDPGTILKEGERFHSETSWRFVCV